MDRRPPASLTREASRRLGPRPARLDHLSFNLPDEEALLTLRKRLLEADCEITDVVDHGFIRSVYFSDNNGIALEASYWVTDGTGRAADHADTALFSDPEPVPAVVELRSGGTVQSTPSTQLAGEWVGSS